jgi:hypothetical protein
LQRGPPIINMQRENEIGSIRQEQNEKGEAALVEK